VIDPVEIARGQEQIPNLPVREVRYFTPKVTFHPEVAHLDRSAGSWQNSPVNALLAIGEWSCIDNELSAMKFPLPSFSLSHVLEFLD
jgi:hypothetical protein